MKEKIWFVNRKLLQSDWYHFKSLEIEIGYVLPWILKLKTMKRKYILPQTKNEEKEICTHSKKQRDRNTYFLKPKKQRKYIHRQTKKQRKRNHFLRQRKGNKNEETTKRWEFLWSAWLSCENKLHFVRKRHLSRWNRSRNGLCWKQRKIAPNESH